MFRRFSVNFAVLSIFLDAGLSSLALYLAAVLRAPLNVLPFVRELPPVRLPGMLFAAFPLIWVGCFLLLDVYDGHKNLHIVDELSSLTLGSLLAVVSSAGLLYLSYRDVSRFLFLLAAALSFGLLLAWRLPAMGIAALLVRLDSPGPVLYRAKRVGENGRIFTMYKFRTMVTGADRMLDLSPDENGQANHKRPDDPRVTRVGRFLRKTSLDELPQLFNVLRGDMSLVGPRPELPELVERYLAWQRERFAVPQGLTGWWQVNGRSDKPMHLHTEEDLFYVRNYSIWLDLKILIKTAWVVLKGKGAF